MTMTSVLIHYDPNLPIILTGDASSYGIGTVISRSFPDGPEWPIAYAYHTLSTSEKKLIFGLNKFHQYLYGRTFIIQTDHKPLTTILEPTQGIPSLAAAQLQHSTFWLFISDLISCNQAAL